LCIVFALLIHATFSYQTSAGFLPDPLLRIFLANVHKGKHGSDTGTFDNEGRYVPQRFEDIFAKYADGRDYLTLWDVSKVLKGQRCIADPIGWAGALFECESTLPIGDEMLIFTGLTAYWMLWPEDGKMMKEDIRGIYDGSIFYTIAARREKR
jgi:peroxygenase